VTEYRLIFRDFLTGAELAELAAPFTLDRRIIQPGGFSTKFEVPNGTVGARLSSIQAGRTTVDVFRGPLLLGTYIIWKRPAGGVEWSSEVSLQGATLESMLYHRFPKGLYEYTAASAETIVDDLLADIQAITYGSAWEMDLSALWRSTPPGGVDMTILPGDARPAGEWLEDLAAAAGLEYMIHTDGGARLLHLSAPAMPASSAALVIEQPGSITSWRVDEDALAGGTAFYARGTEGDRGDGQAGPVVSEPAIVTPLLDAGWPAIEVIEDVPGTNDPAVLAAMAAGFAAARPGAAVSAEFEVHPERLWPQGLGPHRIGSPVRVVLANPIYPLGSDGSPSFGVTGRLVGFSLSVDASGVESVKLDVERGT
jgi:hypothetical protein